MTEKIVISNINQFMNLAAKQPGLLNVGGFSFLRKIAASSGGGCNNKCGKVAAGITELRPQWEATFAVLSPAEQNQMKSMLDTKQICYLARQANGQLKSKCF